MRKFVLAFVEEIFTLDPQQPTSISGTIRSSSSSHSSFTSDEQSIFFPMSTHPYSSSSSQIFATNPPSSSTTANSTNSNAKSFLPNSLSITNQTFSSLQTSNTTSPTSAKLIDPDPNTKDGDTTPSDFFASPNSFFSNGHKGKVSQSIERILTKNSSTLYRFCSN